VAVEYTLSMPAPHTHLFDVQVRIPAAEHPLELVMPSWTPGSYLLREFPRNVQDFAAHDSAGLPLAHRKIDKNRWRVEDSGAPGPVTVRYRVYANELSVRTSHLDASHGYVNGASVFMYARGLEGERATVRVEAPDEWRVATSLRELEDGSFAAENYDELVDCPMEIGPHRTLAWEQHGIPHRYVIWGPGEVDEARLIADTRRIIEVCAGMFGGLPYDRYLLILHLAPEVRGGLEHATSTSLLVTSASVTEDYESLIALVAHEFFHVWLAKRIRPVPLGPFDYTRENYTRNLWVVEGFTTYYTDRILLHAGLMTPARYLERLGDSIARLRAVPGRHHQTLEDSSFDAWIKFYRPDAHSPNSQVSYYHKGSLVALTLDLEIRRASGGERSLDDVLRLLWERSGQGERGFPEEGEGAIQDVVEEVHGGCLEDLFARYVRGTEEIDFEEHLGAAGLRLEARVEGGDALERGIRGEVGAGAGDGSPAPGRAEAGNEVAGPDAARRLPPRITRPPVHESRLGMRLVETGGRVRVAFVLEGTPAHHAGVNAGDELLAVDGVRLTVARLGQLLGGAEEGDLLRLLVMRRDRVVALELLVGEEVARQASLAPDLEASEEQFTVLMGWLGRRAGRVDGSSAAG
jgi:predicted metalloprotease with PDZ domain